MNRELTEKQLKAIHLLVHKAVSKDEVAKKLGVSVSTIYAWLNRNERFSERYVVEKTKCETQKIDSMVSKAKAVLIKLNKMLYGDKFSDKAIAAKALLKISAECLNRYALEEDYGDEQLHK